MCLVTRNGMLVKAVSEDSRKIGKRENLLLWPIQKLLHFGIPDRSNVHPHELGKCFFDETHLYLESWRYPTLQAIPATYGESAFYIVACHLP